MSKQTTESEFIEAITEMRRRTKPTEEFYTPHSSGSTEVSQRGFLREEDMFEYDRARGHERVFHGKSSRRHKSP